MRKFSVLMGLAGVLSLSLLTAVAPVQAEKTDSATIDQYSQGLGAGAVGQVSSVSELTDVDPNTWAFQSLKSLVERYGCIEGYPSKKYLGNKPTSRYEFAAGLNACLEKVNELISAGLADKVSKDDLAALQRLQEEFAAELATLRGRVDALEAKTKELESKQFSTTTKLDGSVVMAVQGGGTSSGADFINSDGTVSSSSAANTTFVARTTLNLRSTFSGKDELLIRLRGVSGQDISSTYRGIAGGLGTLFYAAAPPSLGGGTFDGSGIGTAPTNGLSNVTFDKIRYVTPIFGDNFRIFVGPRVDIFESFDTNSFANNEEADFSSGFFINNPLTTFIFAGPGGGFDWAVSDAFSLRGIYIASKGGLSFGNGGFTGDGNTTTLEAEFRAGTAKLKLDYTANIVNKIGSVYGGANAEWAVAPSFGIFGRYNFGTSYDFTGGEVYQNAWAVGANIGDFIAPGAVLGAAFGQAPRGRFGLNGIVLAEPNSTENDIEVFYKFPLSDRLTLTPDLQVILNGNNINNPTITIGTLRAVFTF